MKVRVGFVTNSSSSSFVLIVKKADIDKAINNLDEEQYNKSDVHKVLNYAKEDDITFLGEELVIFATMYNQGDSTWDYFDEELEGEDPYPGELFDAFRASLAELELEHIGHDSDM